MSVKFREENHCYCSVDPQDTRIWTSVSKVLDAYKIPFQDILWSEYCAINPVHKLYGLAAAQIREVWRMEKERSIKLGKWYHSKQEAALCCKNMCPVEDGWKYALPQEVTSGVYPEFIVYNEEHDITGQIDQLIIDKRKIVIRDYKTNKKLKTEGFKNQMMKSPLAHIGDANLNHYALQLSLYAYMVLYNNPGMVVDKLIIEHVMFKVARWDKFGYPVYQVDDNDEYIIESKKDIQVPYLSREIRYMLEHREKKIKQLQQEQ